VTHDSFAATFSVPEESVLRVRGTVIARPEQTVNPNMPTGEIDVEASDVEVLNRAEDVPIRVRGPVVCGMWRVAGCQRMCFPPGCQHETRRRW